MNVERVVRRIGYTVIAVFLCAFFLPLVGFSLYQGVRRNPRAILEFAQIPGCWMMLLGPILFWVALVVFYYRIPKKLRRLHVSEYRWLNIRALGKLFREYHRLHGFDWLLWLITASGVFTVVLVLAAVNNLPG